ncbi:alpha/beta-type small acid-soluble spore protein [Alicyclobacillus mengziensis]|uniref:Alpha/beta-type small acid-soluble spore protein n=1 Tax=Alicyclobacillus mengziensis TaxID=2931921 RepID=A0A9X7Z613_9BACL|nr:alpha/beta-type small acid-soluble spore protein [Alicyclobacillus mengziensis]QSO45815.1 alpha/beta-type small acid-soluble spore protein [Alicyclobacillus mengziensis]
MPTQQQRNQSNNQRLVPLAESALDQMKYEIASEFGVVLGGDTTSRENGSVGGEMTKRMVAFAESQMAGRSAPITH